MVGGVAFCTYFVVLLFIVCFWLYWLDFGLLVLCDLICYFIICLCFVLLLSAVDLL